MEIIKENIWYILAAAGVALTFLATMLAFKWREVVPTNMVDIVQSRKQTTSYGGGLQANGNVYYAFPSYLPVVGITRISLPVTNFEIPLLNYEAYDKDRVPFLLSVVAFFHIADTNKTASRVQSFEGLKHQLTLIMQGAVRKILASHDIHSIMTDRSTFGEQFTAEVGGQLQSWGCETVKNMELMDIKDFGESQVIHNIMAKKSSHIEMESRAEVAANMQKAETAEIEAGRTIELSKIEAGRTTELSNIEAKKAMEMSRIEANQAIGARSAEQQKVVGVANEKAQQETQVEKATTTQKEMEVLSVKTQRQAEIERAAAVTRAEQEALVLKKIAEGTLTKTKLDAEGVLETQTKEAAGKLEQAKVQAEGTRLIGTAKAEAEAAILMAPVTAQTALAKEIGANEGYQTYLVSVKQIEANQAVGIAQAAALQEADIKVIANTGDAPAGLNSLGDLFSSGGGQKVGALLAALENNPSSKKVIDSLTATKSANGVS